MSPAAHERDAVWEHGAQALRCARLLRKARRWHGHYALANGQRNAQPAEEPPAEARALAADAEDGGIGGLPAEIRQEGYRLLGPGLGNGYVDVAIGVGFDRRDGHRGAQ